MHFEKDFQMVSLILGLKLMDLICKDQDQISKVREKLKSLLNEFDIKEMEDITFVTDRGTNIIKALESNTRLNCSSHLFANVLDKSFEETVELADVLFGCKKVVKYFKKANLQHKLVTSLKNPCQTRWNSNYNMCKSIFDNWPETNNILTESNENHRLQQINITTLNVIVKLCKNVEIIFKEMQTCSSASICFVIP